LASWGIGVGGDNSNSDSARETIPIQIQHVTLGYMGGGGNTNSDPVSDI